MSAASKPRAARSKPWWSGQQWEVIAFTVDGVWKPIYQQRTRAAAVELASQWTRDTQQQTKVQPGPGHRLNRDR